MRKDADELKFQHTLTDVASFFSVTVHAVEKWRENPSFPKDARNGKKNSMSWDLKKIFDWYINYFLGNADMTQQIAKERLNYQQARALREKLEVEEYQRNLINIKELKDELDAIFIKLKQSLLLREKRLPAQLENKSQKAMLKIIHADTVDILQNWSQGKERLCRR